MSCEVYSWKIISVARSKTSCEVPRVDETSSANSAMSTKHYNCEKVKFYVVVAVSSKASVIFLILCLRPHPSKRGRVRLQSLDMSITQ